MTQATRADRTQWQLMPDPVETTGCWLAVVARDHVRRGVELGVAPADHGKRAQVERMRSGDGLVYYSPRTEMREGAVVKAFTALGVIDDRPVRQAGDQDGCFRPWRRAVRYDTDVREGPIDTLRGELELTSAPNWGVVLRRGLVRLSAHDFEVISRAMVAA